jgi:hypothetical protein
MNRNIPLHPLWFILSVGLALPLGPTAVTRAAEATPQSDPELAAKEREAKLAEAEARVQKALKETAEAKKDVEEAANSELRRAEREKAKAQAEQAISEAEKARFMAQLPTPSSKPLEGKIDIDEKAGYFAEILAYDCVRDNAASIAQAIKTKLKDKAVTKVYLVKQSDYLKGAIQLQEVENRLKTFGNTFDDLLNMYLVERGTITRRESVGLLALAAIPAALGTIADVAALFRVDRSLKGRTTSVTDDALIAEVARAIMQKRTTQEKVITVMRPSLFLQPKPAILNTLQEVRGKAEAVSRRLEEIRQVTAIASNRVEATQTRIANVQKSLDRLAADKAEERTTVKADIKRLKDLWEKVPPDHATDRAKLEAEIKSRESELKQLKNSEEQEKKVLTDKLDKLNTDLLGERDQKAIGEVAIAVFDGAVKTFYQFTGGLVSATDGGTSPLATLAELCLLRDCGPDTRIVSVAVVSQGGEVETRKSLWTSGRVYHRAGSVCSYVLFDNEGNVIDSGLCTANQQRKEGKPINVTKRPASKSVQEQAGQLAPERTN